MLMHNYAKHTITGLGAGAVTRNSEPGIKQFTKPVEKGNFPDRSKILL